jgi:hypothetical protein
MITNYHPLGLHPLSSSSRALVSEFDREIVGLVQDGTQNRRESIIPAAQRIAGQLFADGVVSSEELEVLGKIKAQLGGALPTDAEALADRQATANLYDAVQVDEANRTVTVSSPKFEHLDLPDHAFLPSNKRLLHGMENAAADLMVSAWDPAKYQVALAAAAKSLVGDGLSDHQKGLVEAMGTAAKKMLSHMTFSQLDYQSSLCKNLVDLAGAMGAPAK